MLLLDGAGDVLGGVGFDPEEIAGAGLIENEVEGRRVSSNGNGEGQREAAHVSGVGGERSRDGDTEIGSDRWQSVGVGGTCEGAVADSYLAGGVLLDTRGSEGAVADGVVAGERGAGDLGKQDAATDVGRVEIENESAAATAGVIGIERVDGGIDGVDAESGDVLSGAAGDSDAAVAVGGQRVRAGESGAGDGACFVDIGETGSDVAVAVGGEESGRGVGACACFRAGIFEDEVASQAGAGEWSCALTDGDAEVGFAALDDDEAESFGTDDVVDEIVAAEGERAAAGSVRSGVGASVGAALEDGAVGAGVYGDVGEGAGGVRNEYAAKDFGIVAVGAGDGEGIRAGELREAARDGLSVERAGGGAAGVGLREQGMLAVDDDEAEGFRAGDAESGIVGDESERAAAVGADGVGAAGDGVTRGLRRKQAVAVVVVLLAGGDVAVAVESDGAG